MITSGMGDRYTEDGPGFPQVGKGRQETLESPFAPAEIGLILLPLDTDGRGDMAQPGDFFSGFFVNQRPVGIDQKVTVMVFGQDLPERPVYEGFTAGDDIKKIGRASCRERG